MVLIPQVVRRFVIGSYLIRDLGPRLARWREPEITGRREMLDASVAPSAIRSQNMDAVVVALRDVQVHPGLTPDR